MSLRQRIRSVHGRARGFVHGARFVARSGVATSLLRPGLVRFARDVPRLGLGPEAAAHLHACIQPHTEAVVDRGQRYSFAEVDEAIARLAAAMRSLGVSSGDNVALMLPNSMEQVVALDAISRVGALAVEVGTRLKASEIAHVVDSAKPQLLLYDHRYAEEVIEATDGRLQPEEVVVCRAPSDAPVWGTTYEDIVARERPTLPRRGIVGKGGGVIIYTSGTTGAPKGATRLFRETDLVPAFDLLERLGVRAGERHLVVCPMYHSAAMAVSKMVSALGGTLVLLQKFDAEEALATIESESITSMFVVPTMIVRWNHLSDDVVRGFDTSSLRWVLSGAAPLPTIQAQTFQERFGPILYNFYGATELGLVSMAGPSDHARGSGCVGTPLMGVETAIIREDGEEAGPGVVGEVFVHSGMLMRGYYGVDPSEGMRRRGDFASVGDLAHRDDDGYLYLASRKSDMIISGGVNIYPREIEDVLHQHPAVQEAAVVGIADEEWGEVPVAFVVARQEGVEAEELRQYLRDKLADFKVPKRVAFIDEFPRNTIGKVLRAKLKAAAGE